jgi:hypothetical protein
MRLIASALLLMTIVSVAAFEQPNSSPQSIRTPVVITELSRRAEISSAEGTVRGASTSSRLVLFLRFANQRGLYVASDRSGTPQLPRIVGTVPPPSFEGRVALETRWHAQFYVPASERLEEVYAVVCDVRSRANSTPEGDYGTFRYLPFREATDIEDALTLLRDFGWLPTGFTRIAPK